MKAKRSPRSETLCWSLANVELVRSGELAAESNTINEKRTKTLAKSIVEISFIKPSPKGTKGWVLATTSFSLNWEQILREQVTCPIRSCGQEMKIGAVGVLC